MSTSNRTTIDADCRLPTGEEIFLDHVGHFVRDAQAAAHALAQAGFTPTPISVQVDPDPPGGAPQPTGTGNVTAMLERGYLEVLFKSADTPLGRELEAALARHAGVHLAAFAVADAGAAHRRLQAAGFQTRPLVNMHRPIDTETGSGVAAFTVARVVSGAMPEGRMQILTHRTEATVWQRRWLTHRNGAVGLLDLMIAVADVDEAAHRFARFTARPAMPTPFGQAVVLDRGRVQLVRGETFVALFSDLPVRGLPFCGAYGVRVLSLDNAEAVLRAGQVDCRRDDKRLVARFPGALGVGAWVFVEAAQDLSWR